MNNRLIAFTTSGVLLASSILWVSLSHHEGVASKADSQAQHHIDPGKASADQSQIERSNPQEVAGIEAMTTAEESSELSELKSALLEPVEDERYRRFLDGLRTMKPGDALAVALLLKKLKELGRQMPVEAAAFWRRWGEIDPGAAMKQATAQGAGANVYKWALQGWATADPEAAREWLNDHSQDSHFESAFLGFLDGYVQKDLNAATKLTFASLKPDDPLLAKALNSICNRVFEQSYATGLKQWFNQLPTDERSRAAKEMVANDVYRLLVQKDLKTTMDWLRTEADTAGRQKWVMIDMSVRYGAVDPPAAMDLLASLPGTSESKWPGAGYIVKQWMRSDIVGFETWLRDNKGLPVYQHVVHDYAQIIAATDTAKATVLAAEIADPAMREAILRRLNGEPPPRWVTRETTPADIAQFINGQPR